MPPCQCPQLQSSVVVEHGSGSSSVAHPCLPPTAPLDFPLDQLTCCYGQPPSNCLHVHIVCPFVLVPHFACSLPCYLARLSASPPAAWLAWLVGLVTCTQIPRAAGQGRGKHAACGRVRVGWPGPQGSSKGASGAARHAKLGKAYGRHWVGWWDMRWTASVAETVVAQQGAADRNMGGGCR